MQILTTEKNIVTFTKDDDLVIEEKFYKNQLIGINVTARTSKGEYILDTYEDDNVAELVTQYIFDNSDKQKLDIEQLNKQLEIF